VLNEVGDVLMPSQLLKPAGRDLAVLMVVLALLGIPIAMLNERRGSSSPTGT